MIRFVWLFCSYLWSLSNASDGNAWVCDDGSSVPEVHLQFSAMVDMAAFPKSYESYRESLVRVINSLEEKFGPQTETQAYTFATRPRPGFTPEWCGNKIADFSKASAVESLLTTQFSSVGLVKRVSTDSSAANDLLSSLNDNIFHSFAIDNWTYEARDSVGLPIVHFVHIATDTVPWNGAWDTSYSGSNHISRAEYKQFSEPNDWCADYCYIERPDMVIAGNTISPQNQLFVHILAAEGPSVTVVPSTVDYFKNSYYDLLGVGTLNVDDMKSVSEVESLIFERIKKAACNVGKFLPPPTPSVTTTTPTPAPLGTTRAAPIEITSTIAAAPATPDASWVCGDGRSVPEVHLQFSAMVDMAAFPTSYQSYRENLVRVINSLEQKFGPQTEAQAYAFANRPRPGYPCEWCGKKVADFGKAADVENSLAEQFAAVGLVERANTDTTRDGDLMSSLSDNLFHSFTSDNWTHEARDAAGLPIVHFVHIGTDTVPWRGEWKNQYTDYGYMGRSDWHEYTEPNGWCSHVQYALDQDITISRNHMTPQDQLFIHILAAEGPSISTFPSTVNFFKNTYGDYLGAGTVKVDDMEKSSELDSLIFDRIKDAVCNVGTFLPPPTPTPVETTIAGPVDISTTAPIDISTTSPIDISTTAPIDTSAYSGGSWVCEDGSLSPKVHLQFSAMVDMAAFPTSYQSYRSQLIDVIDNKLVQLFGTRTEIQAYTFADRPVRGHSPGWCGRQITDLTTADNAVTALTTEFGNIPNLVERSCTDASGSGSRNLLSSLYDNIWQSFAVDNWDRSSRDADGLPLVHFVHIATDTVPWSGERPTTYGGLPSVVSSNYASYKQPNEWCEFYEYPTANSTQYASSLMGPAGQLYIQVLAAEGPSITSIPSTVDWFNNSCAQELGVENLHVDDMSHTSRYGDVIVRRIMEAVCDIGQQIMTTTPAPIEMTTPTPIAITTSAPIETTKAAPVEITTPMIAVPATDEASWVCDDGSSVPEVHLQFSAMVDMAAFPISYQSYRESLVRVINSLEKKFGPQTEAQAYTFATRPQPGVTPEWCGKKLADFSKASAIESLLTTQFSSVGLVSRVNTDASAANNLLSSLNDNVFNSFAIDNWTHEPRDSVGLPIVHFVHIATDTVPWRGEWATTSPSSNHIARSEFSQYSEPNDWCADFDNIEKPDMVSANNMMGPQNQLFIHVIAAEGPSITTIPSTVNYFKNSYYELLGAGILKVDDMENISQIDSLIFDRIREAACHIGTFLPPPTPSINEMTTPTPVETTIAGPVDISTTAPIDISASALIDVSATALIQTIIEAPSTIDADWVCQDGKSVPQVHLQFSAIIDMAAFPANDFYIGYRNGLVEVVRSLESKFGSQTEVQAYSFSNRPLPGENRSDSWCGKKVSPFATPSDAAVALSQEFTDYGIINRPMTDDGPNDSLLSSLDDNVWHSFSADNWIRSSRDSAGLPVVHFMHIATDTVPWRDEWKTMYSSKPTMTARELSGLTSPNEWCKDHAYVWRDDLYDAAQSVVPVEQLYMEVMVAEGPKIKTIPSTVGWFNSNYSQDLGDVKMSVDDLANGFSVAELIMNRIRDAACDVGTLVPPITMSTEMQTRPAPSISLDMTPIVSAISFGTGDSVDEGNCDLDFIGTMDDCAHKLQKIMACALA